jgi:hypothetical protein
MATLSPANRNAQASVRIKHKPPVYVVMAGCDTCGQIHIIQFRNKREFLDAYCPNEQQPIYLSAKGKEKIWREFQNDLMDGTVD